MFCTECGKQIPDTSKFCPECGQKVTPMAGGSSSQAAPTAPSPSSGGGSLPGTITNSIGMKFVLIRAGEFMMGAGPEDEEARDDEKPQHLVRITKDFYMGQYPVTQGQWQALMGNNPSHFKGSPDLPVENVSWYDAKNFADKLSAKEKVKEKVKYRLPTEAEWEYAARAGTTDKYYWGNWMDGDYCWYDENSGNKTHPVGQKKPNEWGLYDMLGNVYEWCRDQCGKDYYGKSPAADPTGPSFGDFRALRGGSWCDESNLVRVSNRYGRAPAYRYRSYGFRLVRAAL